jgi:tRNA threonylcarbamoyladenosine biosynthesis protein TsaB
MIILTLRTDKPDAELALYENERQVDAESWLAHRQLAETLHSTIKALLEQNDMSLEDVGGIVCFQGPGSFTGLRIGLTVANTMAYSYDIPVVASQEPDWAQTGVGRLLAGESDKLALPFYGADVHITPQKK